MQEKKRIIMIHEVDQTVLNKLRRFSTSEDIFTFDDGLYSNYLYLEELLKFPNQKIFFCSTDIIRDKIMRPNKKVIPCGKAHALLSKLEDSGLANYMSWEELKEIDKHTNCFIGVHGHKHIRITSNLESSMPKRLEYFNSQFNGTKKEVLDFLKDDTKTMYHKYYKVFGKVPKSFCFPYNKENYIYKAIIRQEFNILKKELGISSTNQTSIKIYGKGRINVNEL